MKSLTRTIIVLAVLNLAMGDFVPAQAESLGELGEPTTRSRGWLIRTFTISGKTGLGGVMMLGLPGNVVTDLSGYYSATVEHGWSGTVRPTKDGYTFEPAELPYSDLIGAQANQDYVANVMTFTISGTASMEDVEMQGLPGNPVTGRNGTYQATVDYGWSGRVRPVKEGYKFEPASMTYRRVVSDRDNQNYVATPITYIISGEVGVGGVLMKGLPGHPVTGRDGTYQATVYYGWSGTVTPTKKGYGFEPSNRPYSKVTHNQSNQNYSPRRVGPAAIFGRTGGRKVLVIPATGVNAKDLDWIRIIFRTITRDLQVMSHIFDERFKEPSMIKGVFTDFGDFFGRDSRATEAIYLQGYGALFLMEVNFTFSPLPRAQEKESKKTEEDVDPTWQRAKQKIFSPKGTMPGVGGLAEQESGLVEVEELKTELIKTLKHAANIRNLTPDEWIIVTVIGQGRQQLEFHEDYYRSAAPSSGTTTSRRPRRPSSRLSSSGGGGFGGGGGYSVSGVSGSSVGYGSSYSRGPVGGGYAAMEYGEIGPPSATILTIRVKKSDVDDFAKGEMDFEQFQQRVQIFMY